MGSNSRYYSQLCVEGGEETIRFGAVSEEQEQVTFVEWLELKGILYAHIPNGGNRHPVTGAKLKRLGVKAGLPDILIWDKPPNRPGCVGVAIEMKRKNGGKATDHQKRWLSALRERDWHSSVCHGAGEAIELCEELGF